MILASAPTLSVVGVEMRNLLRERACRGMNPVNAGYQTWDHPYSSVSNPENNMEYWYAVHTRARHESAVALRLRERGVTVFLPTVTEVHRWNDRRKIVKLPLFSCYVFVKLIPNNQERQRVLRTDSVL